MMGTCLPAFGGRVERKEQGFSSGPHTEALDPRVLFELGEQGRSAGLAGKKLVTDRRSLGLQAVRPLRSSAEEGSGKGL